MGGGVSALTRKRKQAVPHPLDGEPHPVARQPGSEPQAEERQAASAMAPADATPPPASPAKSPVSLHPAETSASGRSSEEQEAEVIEDDDDDDLDPLDIERIEADYRATRARAIFSAGAAARVVRLERMREHAQTALKRQAEADLWRKHVEVKAIQLQAKLLEQRSILTWGPVALETGRLDKEAVLQLQQGMKHLNDTIADLETISRLNTPSTQPNSARMSPAVEGLGEHTVVTGEHCDWPMPFPSTRPSDSDYVMPAVSTQRARRRPWSWKGRQVTSQKVQRVISECINSWSPAVTDLDSLPRDSRVFIRDHFEKYLDTPRSELEDPRSEVEDPSQIESNAEGEDWFEKFKREYVASHSMEAQNEGTQGLRADQEKDDKAENEEQDGKTLGETDEMRDDVDASEGGNKRSARSHDHDRLEMSIDVGENGVKSLRGSAASPTSPHSGLQQSVEEEDEPTAVVHQMWAPSTKSLEMSDTIGNGLAQTPSGTKSLQRSQRIGDLDCTSSQLKVIKESSVKLPRILGLDKFQHAYEKRLNLTNADDYMKENSALASKVRDMIADIRSKIEKQPDQRKRYQETESFGRQPSDASNNSRMTTAALPKLCDTIADAIMALQDELADLEATFRLCHACSGHFTGDAERRGPPPFKPEKTSLEIDLEKLAHFAANEMQPALRDSLSAAVTVSYGATEQGHGAIKESILQQLESQPISFYSTTLRKTAALPTELEAEVIMKRSKARSDLVVNLKKELMAYQKVQGTTDCVDLQELETYRERVQEEVRLANERRERMKVELASTLKIQGIWRGVACRETFRRKGIHISSPLEEYTRKYLLPQLESIMKSKVAIRREMDHSIREERIFAGMVNQEDKAHGWGCMIFPKSDPKGRSCYMGEFAGGLMHGVGVLYFQQHETRYEGQFQKGMSHGFGLEYYASGSIYQGQFERDCRHGLGIYTWSSGLSYGGTWLQGIQHGEGVETNINLPIDPARPKSGILQSLNQLSKDQHDSMVAGEMCMAQAREFAAKDDAAAAKQAIKDAFLWMDKAHQLSQKLRQALEAQAGSSKKLVKFDRGKKIVKEKVDPNLLATEILEGGWVELDIDYPKDTENLASQSEIVLESDSADSPDSANSPDSAKSPEMMFFGRFPDAKSGPLKPGEPALVVAQEDVENPWSLFQIQIKTENDELWWYEKDALRPAQPSLKEKFRREAERFEREMAQRELDEIQVQEIMVQVSRVLESSVHFADWAKAGAAQTAAACNDVLGAMKRMPTLKSVDPKTHDGADFLRALKKHRELEELEEADEARAALQEDGEEKTGVEEGGKEDGEDSAQPGGEEQSRDSESREIQDPS